MSTMRERVAELERRRTEARAMGGPERVERQHARHKLDVRQRIERLFDPGTFVELGMLANNNGALPEDGDKPAPADGVVTGFGEIDGRTVCCAAYDFTVFGGSIGVVGERKVARLREMALRQRVPMVWLVDSAGARIGDTGGFGGKELSSFADTGYLFREQVVMSGVVPQVAAMVGPGAAGTAYIPGLADFVPMVKGTSSMAIGGPYLVKSTVGEDVTEEQLGGSKIHNELSGCADQEYADDAACLAAIREYLSFFPSHCEGPLPRRPTDDPAERREEALLEVIPEESRRAYDVRKVISLIVDDGRLFEMKPKWAKNICTGLARIDGRSVGIVANNPQYLGGILDVNAADKAARFVNLCDAFRIPLVFLEDVPGFMVGTKVEQAGIIRHGAKFLYAVSSATVPKFTVVLRKAYGAGYYVMNGRAYEPDLFVAWPGAEISVMGAEGLVSIAAAKVLASAEDPAATKKALADSIRPFINIYRVAAMGMVDDVIDPRDTRPLLARALKLTENKRIERPHRRREISPV
jgi:acetyl-CoA carboxylase carboxyltransferase component